MGPTPTKAASPRLKVIIRRLPPGLTEQEFYSSLGEEWKRGERVDWASFKPGKVSKDPAKPSRPARAYLHLIKPEYLSSLSDKVQETQFSDSKGSGSDPVLLGPPTVEFAPYGRVPNGRVRKDARQGTIDQDSEFIDFLESLTNPTTKPTLQEGGSDTDTKKEEVKVTPLVQFIKDKKANKAKEAAAAVKAIKHNRNDSKESKASQGSEKKASPKDTRDTSSSVDKRSASAIKVEKIARDAAKVLIKQANTSNKTLNPSPAAASAALSQQSPTPAVSTDRRRERAAVSAAARIQRDLGLAGSPGGRRRRDAPASAATPTSAANSAKQTTTPQSQNNAASPASATSAAAPSSSSRSTPLQNTTITTQKPPAAQPPTGPATTRTPNKPANPTPPRSHPTPNSATSRPAPAVTPTATQAFLKHANPSQGITEPLLEAAFAPFGTISKVEIDKKKGFAYIDFAEPEGLQKSIAASPVKVAQGQVVVLERKTGPTLQARNNLRGGATTGQGNARGGHAPAMGPRGGGAPMIPRGGRGGGRGGRGGMARGGAAAQAPQKQANPATAATDTPAATSPNIPAAEPIVAPVASATEAPIKAVEAPS
ncbi:hypothetical protein MMC30_006167 [Trapelia coarctata]|nr:hypothetical protein [Trapelia coarctata]